MVILLIIAIESEGPYCDMNKYFLGNDLNELEAIGVAKMMTKEMGKRRFTLKCSPMFIRKISILV
jgi:hypothetical protein